MSAEKIKFTSVDLYIKTFPKEVQSSLQEIRKTIKDTAPDAEEVISYQMPAFKLKSKRILYLAAWKKHISLYPITADMIENVSELSDYYTSGKGTIHFGLDKPMPVSLVRKIVLYLLDKD